MVGAGLGSKREETGVCIYTCPPCLYAGLYISSRDSQNQCSTISGAMCQGNHVYVTTSRRQACWICSPYSTCPSISQLSLYSRPSVPAGHFILSSYHQRNSGQKNPSTFPSSCHLPIASLVAEDDIRQSSHGYGQVEERPVLLPGSECVVQTHRDGGERVA